jgi:hypothetical protein
MATMDTAEGMAVATVVAVMEVEDMVVAVTAAEAVIMVAAEDMEAGDIVNPCYKFISVVMAKLPGPYPGSIQAAPTFL